MIARQASAAWQSRQAQLLKQTYTAGWQAGVRGYRSQYATPPVTMSAGGALPTRPNSMLMSRALAPALLSLARMGAQLAVLAPAALGDFMAANAWRLAAGVSVVWAGEMAGYAQAAAADGLLLEWELDPNPAVEHCTDCPQLAALPPLPLDLWPTLPGEGLTECNVGCKCSLRAVAAPMPSLTGEQHELLSRIGNRQPVLVAA